MTWVCWRWAHERLLRFDLFWGNISVVTPCHSICYLCHVFVCWVVYFCSIMLIILIWSLPSRYLAHHSYGPLSIQVDLCFKEFVKLMAKIPYIKTSGEVNFWLKPFYDQWHLNLFACICWKLARSLKAAKTSLKSHKSTQYNSTRARGQEMSFEKEFGSAVCRLQLTLIVTTSAENASEWGCSKMQRRSQFFSCPSSSIPTSLTD